MASGGVTGDPVLSGNRDAKTLNHPEPRELQNPEPLISISNLEKHRNPKLKNNKSNPVNPTPESKQQEKRLNTNSHIEKQQKHHEPSKHHPRTL